MGRPSLVTAQRRPTRSRNVADDSPDTAAAGLTSPASCQSTDTPPDVQFPRRSPRTGTGFQVKVPAYKHCPTVTWDRPAPLLMSQAVPHLTSAEESSMRMLQTATPTSTGSYTFVLMYRTRDFIIISRDSCCLETRRVPAPRTVSASYTYMCLRAS
jgi:hypothetical protein